MYELRGEQVGEHIQTSSLHKRLLFRKTFFQQLAVSLYHMFVFLLIINRNENYYFMHFVLYNSYNNN